MRSSNVHPSIKSFQLKAVSFISCTAFFLLLAIGSVEAEAQTITPSGANILYVDNSITSGNQSGNSWSNAIIELRDALAWARDDWDGSNPPLQIWVAVGTYLPTDDDTDQTAAFEMVNNVEIYGGLLSGETSLVDRNLTLNETILSGDIGEDDLPFAPTTNNDGDASTPTQTDHIVKGNSYHVT